MENDSKKENEKKSYDFGEIKEFDLETIENEVLNDSVYLDVFAGSDMAFKENISSQKVPLEKLLSLNAYRYKYKKTDYPHKNFPSGERFGLMAQEVVQIFPEMVREDEQGLMEVDYGQMIPVLLSGISQLHELIEDQSKEIEVLKKALR